MDSGRSNQVENDTAALERLRLENEELRKQLQHLLTTASNNEKIWRHFTEIERILFRTRQLDVLVEELLREIKVRFEPDYLVLFLSHTDIIEQFFPEICRTNEPIAENTWVLPLPSNNGCAVAADVCRPSFLNDREVRGLLTVLPEAIVSSIMSGVSVPLCIHEMVFGSLFFGSQDLQRYHPFDSTDLLEQLGVKIALCMDNCLTYEKVKEFSVLDPLTGLMNYFQIHTILEKEARKARRFETPLSILMIEMDFFHPTDGDPGLLNEVLRHAAGVLQEIIPEQEGYLGRFGSNQFLAVLPDVPAEEAAEVVPYLTQAIRRSPFKYQNTAILIQTNIGMGTLSDQTRRTQDLLDAAGTELCRLKMSKDEHGGDPVAHG
ncbi:sensor domain-containing diguanylate cyclase [Desulfoferrobacter suflitae]|uniref:sensor domain-containing diguanylate cyclase n=1 Tax=Desulfoferrobacter suflitae TaxID=2865782 RepID=UPI0021648E05|nr:sensor domain-containing diguanylate cyclase [Desulfoferrobacter suflitae]MCK8601036.1 DUF484 family protein [Desulfoferrobacter suflitae]